MSQVSLNTASRHAGKKAAKAVRNNGNVPGVYYVAGGGEALSIETDPMSLRPIVYTAEAKLVQLFIDGKETANRAILKDVRFHPVSDRIVHFDLMGLKEDLPVLVTVPIKLIGQAAGVRIGGVLQHIIRKVKLKCLPKDLPEFLEVDVTPLNVGQQINLDSLRRPELDFVIKSNPVVVSVAQSRASRSQKA